jgi:glycerol-1-phosphate dehydrogenase [NAD(P)+]
VERIAHVLDVTGFWQAIENDPFSRDEWLAAVRLAPSMKEDYFTVLSSRDCVPEVDALITSDPRLQRCFLAGAA